MQAYAPMLPHHHLAQLYIIHIG